MHHPVNIGRVKIGDDQPLALIAGPGMLENYESARDVARFLKALTDRLAIPFVLKALYDKAHRTSIESFRGPRLADGLKFIEKIKGELNIPVLSDVHCKAEIDAAAGVIGIFVEVHKDPDRALCDGPNSLKLENLESLLSRLKNIRKVLVAESRPQ
jgi:2-dehydro-3-deoxyphosphooctonate aldolase (KDO 8-P synthase)